jgi:hypothetical protein
LWLHGQNAKVMATTAIGGGHHGAAICRNDLALRGSMASAAKNRQNQQEKTLAHSLATDNSVPLTLISHKRACILTDTDGLPHAGHDLKYSRRAHRFPRHQYSFPDLGEKQRSPTAYNSLYLPTREAGWDSQSH